MKKILSVILLFSLTTNIFAKELLIVTLVAPPNEYLENNISKGINVEIVTEVLSSMGYKAKVKFVPWKRALRMVKSGCADAIIDAAYTKERAVYLYYPKEHLNTEDWYCFKKKGNPITLDENLTNAQDIKLGVSRGFHYGGIIQNAIDNDKFKYLDETYNNELNIKKVVAGRFDMFLGVKSTIFFLAKQMGYKDKIEIVKNSSTKEDFLLSSTKTYIAFSKKTMTKEEVAQFSKLLSKFKKDNKIEKIRQKYY